MSMTGAILAVAQAIASALLTREITDALDAERRAAVQRVDAWFNDPGKQKCWLHIEKQEYCARLAELIARPHLLFQGNTGFCQPAACLYPLLRRYPGKMAQFGLNIFERGAGQIGELSIEMTTGLRSSDLKQYIKNKNLRVNVADYLLLLTIQEAHSIFDIDSPDDYSAAPVVLGGDIEEFFADTELYAEVKDKGADFDLVKDIRLEDTEVILTGPIEFFSSAPLGHHAVVLASPFTPTPDSTFECLFWSWGAIEDTNTFERVNDKFYRLEFTPAHYRSNIRSTIIAKGAKEWR